MSARPRNEVAVIAALAPRTVSFLQVPLTASRQAALAAFTARTGISEQQLAVDLIDDVIFDTGVSVELGGVPCTEPYAGGSKKPGKSSARSCTALHDCAAHRSDEPAKGFGHTRQRKNSRLALAARYERPATSSPAIESHPEDRSQPSSLKSAGGRFE